MGHGKLFDFPQDCGRAISIQKVYKTTCEYSLNKQDLFYPSTVFPTDHSLQKGKLFTKRTKINLLPLTMGKYSFIQT